MAWIEFDAGKRTGDKEKCELVEVASFEGQCHWLEPSLDRHFASNTRQGEGRLATVRPCEKENASVLVRKERNQHDKEHTPKELL